MSKWLSESGIESPISEAEDVSPPVHMVVRDRTYVMTVELLKRRLDELQDLIDDALSIACPGAPA